MNGAATTLWWADWRKRAFATPLDTALTLGVGLLLLVHLAGQGAD